VQFSVDEGSGYGQADTEAGRLAASQVQAKRRRERAERDRRLEKLAIEVLSALGERDATIAATEQRAGAALQAMVIDEQVIVAEAVQWCAVAISHREAGRLRQLTRQAHDNKPEDHSATVASIR
jgi:NaMN:DMB phosphoribosyltransferase